MWAAEAWIGVFGFVVIVSWCQNALHNDDDSPTKYLALSTMTSRRASATA
jgi:hypothetical protein